MQTTKFQQRSNLNSYYFDGYEVASFTFYSHETGHTIAYNPRGWFSEGSNNNYPTLEFSFPIIKKMKSDLFRNYGYFTRSQKKATLSNRAKIDVFIPVTLLKNTHLETGVFNFETATDLNYFDRFSFEATAEKWEASLNETTGGLDWNKTELKSHNMKFTFNHNSVPTPFGHKVEKMKAELKEHGIQITGYDLEKLMEKYKLIAY